MSLLIPPPDTITLPYTLFKAGLAKGNAAAICVTGDTSGRLGDSTLASSLCSF